MPTAPEDIDFMEGIRDLLDLDDDEVEDLLTRLDAATLIDLSDAVTNRDRAAAQQAISRVEDDNDLLMVKNKHKREQDRKSERDAPRRKAAPAFQVGDRVKFGKHRATVTDADAPGDTVGITIGDHKRMVDPDKLEPISEYALGMTPMMDLARMRALAGMATQAEPEVAISPLPTAPLDLDEPVQEAPEAAQTSNAAGQIHQLLAQIEAIMPDVTVADLSSIRKHINRMQTSMNESVRLATRRVMRARKV